MSSITLNRFTLRSELVQKYFYVHNSEVFFSTSLRPTVTEVNETFNPSYWFQVDITRRWWDFFCCAINSIDNSTSISRTRSRKWDENVNKIHKQQKSLLFSNKNIFKTQKKIYLSTISKNFAKFTKPNDERKKIITKNINCTAVKQANTWMKLTL